MGTTKGLVEAALRQVVTLKPDETGAWAGENKDLLVCHSCTDNQAIQLNQNLDVPLGCSLGCCFSSNCSSFQL